MPRQWTAAWKSGTCITWRSLNWREFKSLNSRAFLPAELYLEIYKLCILEGPPSEEAPFGIVYWLGNKEFDQNPFIGRLDQVKVAVNEKRAWVSKNYFAACSAVLASVLHMSFKEIEELDADEFFSRIAQAEFLVGKPLDPVDPNKPIKKRRPKPWEPGAKATEEQKTDYTFTK